MTAAKKLNLQDSMSHLSTGGGASLELIEGRGMPGLRALVSSAATPQSGALLGKKPSEGMQAVGSRFDCVA